MSAVAKTYDTPFRRSPNVYKHISQNLADWVDEAIEIRKSFG